MKRVTGARGGGVRNVFAVAPRFIGYQGWTIDTQAHLTSVSSDRKKEKRSKILGITVLKRYFFGNA